jgi:hypothetical protein
MELFTKKMRAIYKAQRLKKESRGSVFIPHPR